MVEGRAESSPWQPSVVFRFYGRLVVFVFGILVCRFLLSVGFSVNRFSGCCFLIVIYTM
jgi:hypothetical protein